MVNLIKKLIPQSVRPALRHIRFLLYYGYYKLVFRGNLIMRANTSDKGIFQQIFVLGECRVPEGVNPKVIIDGGAYVGYSSLWYARQFPAAKIIAVEPDDSNFKVLKQHTQSYPNIKIIQAGLWPRRAELEVIDPGLFQCGFRVIEVPGKTDRSIRAVTIGQILADYGVDRIGLLKIDIEGAEIELFSENCDDWINKVDLLVIELHDRLRPGCREAVYSAVDERDFDISQTSEKLILYRKKA
jgi:FkbM family methyltransferase